MDVIAEVIDLVWKPPLTIQELIESSQCRACKVKIGTQRFAIAWIPEGIGRLAIRLCEDCGKKAEAEEVLRNRRGGRVMISVSAVRGNEVRGEWNVKVTFELDRNILRITEGGITGYESFYTDNSSIDILKKMGLENLPIAQGHPSDSLRRGWMACSGAKGRWDGLFVPAESMRAVAEHFGLWGKNST